METKIAIFKGKQIRKIIHNNEWWFSITDVVEALTDSADPKQYIKKIRQRDSELNSYWGTVCTPLEILAPDRKIRETNCSNTEGIFRIIQSIPSSKAEPLKRWLARVGYERIKEIEDPELATKRTRVFYKAKGYSDDWIEKRMRGIAIREELTDEWKNRGAKEEMDYAILTAEISKATFGMTPSEYKELKGLERQNLRDHMNDLELIFSMLGERATTEITRNEDSKGISKLKVDAQAGGSIAGNARHSLEKKLGRSVISNKNYLRQPESKKKLKDNVK
ncbi:MAG TPA: BRO-N domain-containing protein [Candidatus Wunengus californicus]|uniref:BRO-N domain-containing protein n=1 Tax=Candidatus Wunengus californicus TaxID=3367619 RepID=UPI002AE26492|nr:Bro-N domain-containing protein [Deltaproteobacteria bacterium]MBI2341203.1 Bro-N domain-containing protein [Deltaproteobacteria bacterium]